LPLLRTRRAAPYDTGEPSLSAAAIADPPVYDRARAAARYSSTMRDLIQSFKYGDRREGLPLFGRRMAAAGAELLADADAIVPVPSIARGTGRGA
jgi:predicted amidophosphoribosyltransferase